MKVSAQKLLNASLELVWSIDHYICSTTAPLLAPPTTAPQCATAANFIYNFIWRHQRLETCRELFRNAPHFSLASLSWL